MSATFSARHNTAPNFFYSCPNASWVYQFRGERQDDSPTKRWFALSELERLLFLISRPPAVVFEETFSLENTAFAWRLAFFQEVVDRLSFQTLKKLKPRIKKIIFSLITWKDWSEKMYYQSLAKNDEPFLIPSNFLHWSETITFLYFVIPNWILHNRSDINSICQSIQVSLIIKTLKQLTLGNNEKHSKRISFLHLGKYESVSS